MEDIKDMIEEFQLTDNEDDNKENIIKMKLKIK